MTRLAWESIEEAPYDSKWARSWAWPRPINPCRIVLSMPRNTNGRILRVRCACMAETVSKPNYYGYDHLADVSGVDTLRRAVQVWREHVAAKAGAQ